MAFKLPLGTNTFLLGAVAGAFALAAAGFDGFGWKTVATSETFAAQRARAAVVDSLARICTAQFKAAKDLPARLAALEKADRSARIDVLSRSGHATMTGETVPLEGVPQACADMLVPGPV